MRNRRRVLLLVVTLALVTAAVIAYALLRPDHRLEPPPPLDIPAAEQKARAACAGLVTFERQVDENARGNAVLGTVDQIRRDATSAADQDARWRSLAGGADALRLAIRTNDGPAARVGIDVLRAQCAEVS